MIRSLLLFAHLAGMLTLFAALGVELIALDLLRRSGARSEAVAPIRILGALPRAYGVAFGLILLSGIVLAARVGVYPFAWVRVSFGAMLLMAFAGGPMIRSRVRAIAHDEGAEALRRHADPLLRASIRIRVALGLAVVYLMIAKGGIGLSLAVVGAALLAGSLSTAFGSRRTADARSATVY